MQFILAALASVILWPLYFASLIPLYIIGIPVCFILAKRKAWIARPSQHFDHYVFAWRSNWAWIFGNEEDGVTGPQWWAQRYPDQVVKRAFLWSAIRNPVNNVRFIPYINPVIDPKRVYFVGNSNDPTEITNEDGVVKPFQWSFTWQGIQAGIVLRWQHKDSSTSIRFGWKFLPRDRFGVPDRDYRRIRCPFGVQLHLWRKS